MRQGHAGRAKLATYTDRSGRHHRVEAVAVSEGYALVDCCPRDITRLIQLITPVDLANIEVDGARVEAPDVSSPAELADHPAVAPLLADYLQRARRALVPLAGAWNPTPAADAAGDEDLYVLHLPRPESYAPQMRLACESGQEAA